MAYPKIDSPNDLFEVWKKFYGPTFYTGQVEYQSTGTKPVEVYVGENATFPTQRASSGRAQVPSSFIATFQDGKNLKVVEICNFDGMNPPRAQGMPETGRRNPLHLIKSSTVLDPKDPRQRMAIMYLDLCPENALSPLWWPTEKDGHKRGPKGMWTRFGVPEIEFSASERPAKFIRVDTVAEESQFAEREYREDQIRAKVSGLHVKTVEAIFDNLVEREKTNTPPRILALGPNVGNPEQVKRSRLKHFALHHYAEFEAEYLTQSTHVLKMIQDAFDYGFLSTDGQTMSFKNDEIKWTIAMPAGISDPKDWLWRNLIPNSTEHMAIIHAVKTYEINRKKTGGKVKTEEVKEITTP